MIQNSWRYVFGLITCLVGVSMASARTLEVVTTTTQLTDLVKTLGGEQIRVNGLMGASVDPHLFKATAQDVQLLQRADLIFYNGLHLEGRLTDVMERLAERGKSVYAVAEAIPEELLLISGEDSGSADPHIWFDIELWEMVSDYVVSVLVEKDPTNADIYERNGKQFRSELADLAKWAKARVTELGEDERILVTSHDAYNYFGRYFGFRVIGIQGISTVTEAGLADMAAMVDFIRANQVRAIFVETSVSSSTIERVSRDSGAEIGGSLYSDAMGKPGDLVSGEDGEHYDVGTYLGMLKSNIDTIVKSLKEGTSDE